MGQDEAIRKILESRKPGATQNANSESDGENDAFFGITRGEGLEENFLELRFASGMRTCFPYHELSWFNYDPKDGQVDMEFGGYLISLKGRGLDGRIFDGIKQKRLAWVKEKEVEMQDHAANKVYIEAIHITPPSMEGAGEETA